ncbi:MAG: hypothetical protein QNJ92_04220 [Alphaproteobacteria bacterium]|nr:hypothetical protein [Alphaproteobacteria bacterium]
MSLETKDRMTTTPLQRIAHLHDGNLPAEAAARAGADRERRGNGRESLLTQFLRRRRGPWENLATAIIAIGVLMLMQPFALSLFTYSFITILTGTVMFVIVSHFRE